MKTNGVDTVDTDKRPAARESAAAAVAAAPPRYGVCSISIPTQTAVYDGRRNAADKSTVLATVLVPIAGSGMMVESRIYARLDSKTGEIIPGASPLKGTSFADENAREAFIEHVETAVSNWTGYAAAFDAAEARLMGTRPKTVVDGARRLLPRLVKRTAPDAGAAGATAAS